MKKLQLFFLVTMLSVPSFGQAVGKTQRRQDTLKILFAGRSDGHATRAQIMANPVFTCNDTAYRIVHFTLSMRPPGADYVGPYGAMGAKLTAQQISAIRNCTSKKTTLYFEDIKIKEPGGATRTCIPYIVVCDD